jgi:hypothetical protein
MTAPSAMKSEGADTDEETGEEVAEEAETKEE